MKQRNGFGSVHKLPGKRRKPWRVRKTNGWAMNKDGTKLVQQYITIGYYETRQEALQALADYNQDPYDIKNTTSTFAEVYANGQRSISMRYARPQHALGNQRTIIASPYGI